MEQRQKNLSGTCFGISLEGYRPFVFEVQALVSSAIYGTPQRVINGIDHKRLNMLLAVMEKRANFKLTIKDVFINIAGGIKISDPGIDLAAIVAICFCGEVGLSGEIRPVSRITERIREAAKLGFEQIIISGYQTGYNKIPSIDVQIANNIGELVKKIF